MKIKSVSFTTTEINVTSNFTKKTAYMDVASSGTGPTGTRVEVIRKYPQYVSFNNTTGVDVEVAFIYNTDEETEFNANPSDFFFLVPTGKSMMGLDAKFYKIFKVSVRKLSSNATSGMRFDFYQHVGTVVIDSFIR
jgi:hypothetical protein